MTLDELNQTGARYEKARQIQNRIDWLEVIYAQLGKCGDRLVHLQNLGAMAGSYSEDDFEALVDGVLAGIRMKIQTIKKDFNQL